MTKLLFLVFTLQIKHSAAQNDNITGGVLIPLEILIFWLCLEIQ